MSFTITIPVSKADIDRLKFSVDSLEFFGGLQKHTVLFCPTPSVQMQCAEQASRIRAICENTFIDPLPREPEGGGRFGAFNLIFRDAIDLLWKRGNQNPFFWWEVDMTVLQPSPFDTLELEYNRKGKPFMGVRRKASEVMRNADGSPMPEGDPRCAGEYMVAVGIYPPNFREISTMYRYPDPSGAMPTDVLIRHEVSRHLQHTDLIAHHWGTGNYHKNADGQIECEDFKPQLGWPKYGGTLNPMAVVAHGCKDGTLSQLVIASPAKATIIPASNSDDALVRQLRGKLDEVSAYADQMKQERDILKTENESLKADVKNLMDAPIVDTATAAPGFDVKAAQEAIKAAAPKPIPAIQNAAEAAQKAIAALQQANKKILITDLAADIGINKTELRAIIEQPGSGMVISKGPPWVSLAA